MSLKEKEILSAQLREYYHNKPNYGSDEIISKSSGNFRPLTNKFHWIGLQIYINLDLHNSICGLYHQLTDGDLLYHDLWDFISSIFKSIT